MKKIEYKIEHCPGNVCNHDYVLNWLNTLYQEGWELIGLYKDISPSFSGIYARETDFYFKRYVDE